MISIAPNANEDSGRGSFSIPESDNVNVLVLAANTPEVIAIPSGASHVAFAGTVDYWVKFGNNNSVTTVIPSADVVDGTAPELSPALRQVRSGRTHIAIVAAEAARVCISFYGK